MRTSLDQVAQQIIRKHPNIIRLFFKNIKEHLPLGLGEGKVKDALADNIPDWVFDLDESDLREFVERLQNDPDFYRWLRFNIHTLEKILYEG